MANSIKSLFKLGEKFSYTHSGGVSAEGMSKIVTLIANRFGLILPAEYDNRWVIESGPDAGKITKRIENFAFKANSTKIGPEALKEIGEIAKASYLLPKKYLFDFTDKLDWQAGDFGESTGSCYFKTSPDHRYALQMLKDHNSYAVRYYSENEPDKGIGRAWLVFPNNKTCIVYNSYGVMLSQTALLLSTYLELAQQRVRLLNNRTANGMLYINSFVGYELAREQDLSPEQVVDLLWDETEPKCCRCSVRTWMQSDARMVGRESICKLCFERYYFECPECGKVGSKRADRSFCPACKVNVVDSQNAQRTSVFWSPNAIQTT